MPWQFINVEDMFNLFYPQAAAGQRSAWRQEGRGGPMLGCDDQHVSPLEQGWGGGGDHAMCMRLPRDAILIWLALALSIFPRWWIIVWKTSR
jgi:hypothetical protein